MDIKTDLSMTILHGEVWILVSPLWLLEWATGDINRGSNPRFSSMAARMSHRGFEPRTTWLKVKCSTTWASGPCSLSIIKKEKCPEPESNQWHEDFQSSALPTELSGHWVAGTGFEPMTFGLWARRASRLLHPALFNYIYALNKHYVHIILAAKQLLKLSL